jgi:hypothetical protein
MQKCSIIKNFSSAIIIILQSIWRMSHLSSSFKQIWKTSIVFQSFDDTNTHFFYEKFSISINL